MQKIVLSLCLIFAISAFGMQQEGQRNRKRSRSGSHSTLCMHAVCQSAEHATQSQEKLPSQKKKIEPPLCKLDEKYITPEEWQRWEEIYVKVQTRANL